MHTLINRLSKYFFLSTALTVIITVTTRAGKNSHGIIQHIVCSSDPSQSYALYNPSKNNNPLPVIYFFDPHADGSLPLKKYKTLADKYNFILIGSNNSKNGNDWSTTEKIWNTLSGDAQKKLKFNNKRIYLCGFSGGAKVAGYIALHHSEIKSIIANGAGLPDESQPGNYTFSITAVAGEGDMNMTDLVALNNELDKTQTRHRILFFDGIHEWAPATTMDIAFTGLQLDAMYGNLVPKDNGFINLYIVESRKRIDKYSVANNFLKAEEECRFSMNVLSGIDNVIWFKEKSNSIIHNNAYQQQQQSRQNLLVTEQNTKVGYNQQFQRGDINYWTRTINELQQKSKLAMAEGAMYQRLRAYLSLAFYSLSNRFISANQNREAQYFVELYKLADPTNNEAWYLSAIIDARNNLVKETVSDLSKATQLGFTDKTRMMQDRDLQKLAGQIDFSKIVSKMH